jgi:hypothetical protein
LLLLSLLLLVFEIQELLEQLNLQLLVCELSLAHSTEYRIPYESCSIKMHCRLWLPSQLGIGLYPDASH